MKKRKMYSQSWKKVRHYGRSLLDLDKCLDSNSIVLDQSGKQISKYQLFKKRETILRKVNFILLHIYKNNIPLFHRDKKINAAIASIIEREDPSPNDIYLFNRFIHNQSNLIYLPDFSFFPRKPLK